MKYLIYSLFLLLAITTLQCRKDHSTTVTTTEEAISAENTYFAIEVSNRFGKKLENVSMTLENEAKEYRTDNNGIITLEDQKLSPLGKKATFYSPEGVKHQQLLRARDQSCNVMQMILPKQYVSKIAETGQKNELRDGITLSLPGELIDEDGNPYSGNVILHYTYYQIIVPVFARYTANPPGITTGFDSTNNSYKVLSPFGKCSVIAETTQGKRLFLSSGDHAKLEFPISSDQMANVSGNVPLWRYDKKNALWINSGQAEVDGNIFVAKVDLNTSWCIANSNDMETTCIQFVNEKGLPISGMHTKFYVDKNRSFEDAFTDDQGYICCNLPMEEKIKVKIKMGVILIPVKDIGPFSTTIPKDIKIVVDNKDLVTVSGDVTCSGEQIKSGYGRGPINRLSNLFFPIGKQSSFRFLTRKDYIKFFLINPQKMIFQSYEIYSDSLQTDYDMGNLALCFSNEISGQVLLDSNEDGIPDGVVEGAVIKLEKGRVSNVTYKTTTSDQSGHYSFDNLSSDTYTLKIEETSIDKWVTLSGDLEPDGDKEPNNKPVDGEYRDQNFIYCELTESEIDSGNNFILTNKGMGEASGEVYIDLDEDGVKDKSARGIELHLLSRHAPPINLITDLDGKYSIENAPNIKGYIKFRRSITNITNISDYDFTPDPDGDDSNLGPNGKIPIRIITGEVDADNNFLVSLTNSAVVVEVLEDVNNDGKGDKSVPGLHIELWSRAQNGAPQSPRIGSSETNEFGTISFYDVPEGEYVLYYYGSPDYSVTGRKDLIPDNNPTDNAAGGTFLSVNISGKEYDDGNTFIVKHN